MVELSYCNYYKNLLVEELALNPYPHKLHYGKCAVIGRIAIGGKYYFLENTLVSSLPKKYMLADGCVKIPLMLQTYPKFLPVNKTCELFGEAVLCDFDAPVTEKIPITSYDLIQQIESIKDIEENYDEIVKNELIRAQKRYQPALLLHSLNIIDQASELIQHNLEIRMYLLKEALFNKSG